MQDQASSPFLLFDFADRSGQPRSLSFCNPLQVIAAYTIEEVRPALRAVQQAVAAGLYAVGYVAYEAAPAFDPAMVVRGDAAMPLLWFGLFRNPTPHHNLAADSNIQLPNWQPTIDRSTYDEHIAVIREAIARGDTYQVNYTMRLIAQFAGDDLALYRRLRAAQRASFCAYLNLGRYRIISLSPELFFRTDADIITARPMKGTIPRGRWPEEDDEQARILAQSEKDRAENLMIVDLLRNDLGRIAEIGSVHVPRLFAIERYPTVFQMTSTICARVRQEVTVDDIFTALFPCGSVTGAPKLNSMRFIAALEDHPREVYCGAIGMLAPGGELVFSVAIRTLTLDSATGRAIYGVGGGITWDSHAELEYAEALAKAAVLSEEWPVFELVETMRLAHGTYVLLDRHLCRLTESARYFNIPLSEIEIRAALASHAEQYSDDVYRVRLLVDQTGAFRIERAQLCLQQISAPPPVALARDPIDRNNRFLYHKTTYRAMYERLRNDHPDAFDVLLWNEQGELTEFTIGNLVVEIGGRRVTPPRQSGLLAGTLRAELLAQGIIVEQRLMREDLEQAAQVWLINSVRGWVPVSVVS